MLPGECGRVSRPHLQLIPIQVFEMCSRVVAKEIRDMKLATDAGVWLARFNR
jgi:hypothetical protein